MQYIIGLGSNLGDPESTIRIAIDAIDGLSESRVLATSSFYLSTPQGPQDQPSFVNAVILAESQLEPFDLLGNLQSLESRLGRVKTRHWGERQIDLDILFYSGPDINTAQLTIPHPRALDRDFVVLPALEVVPDWHLSDGSKLASHARFNETFVFKKL